eukprot:6189505-Pleurochrysis_carterae.AAC.4
MDGDSKGPTASNVQATFQRRRRQIPFNMKPSAALHVKAHCELTYQLALEVAEALGMAAASCATPHAPA